MRSAAGRARRHVAPAALSARACRAAAGSAHPAGQAAVELVALLPLVVAVALGILQALAAGLAVELAGHSAQSAAVAIAQGRDGETAARAALPGWVRSRMQVKVQGTRVHVRVAPPSLLPGAGQRLVASATADAGGDR